MSTVRRVLLPLVPLTVVLACKAGPEPHPPVAAPQEAAEPGESMPPMDEHFVKAGDIKLAVINGDLAAAKTPAEWMTNSLDSGEVPVKWRAYVPPVKRAAEAVMKAEDLTAAAKGTAEMARACGACHVAMEIEIGTSTMRDPSGGEGEGAHMDRHQWAVDRMYEGLIGPSDEAWSSGAAALMEAPLHSDADASKEVADLAGRVHALGASAKDQTDPQQRAGHYAELIGTCATCHELVGGGK